MIGFINVGLASAQVLVASFSGLIINISDSFQYIIFWSGILILCPTIVIGMSLALLDPQSSGQQKNINYGSYMAIEQSVKMVPRVVFFKSKYT